jgi:polar amino acid transport system substrate-binding protein
MSRVRMIRVRLAALVALLALTGAMLAALAPAAEAADAALTAIKQRGALRIGAAVYPPFMIRKPDGTYEGSDIELLNELARRMEVKLQLVDAGWDTVVEGIATGKWDIVPGLCVTPKRAEVVDFTDPYMDVGGVLGFRPDNAKIKSIEDANNPGIVFADVAGSWNEQVSKQSFPKAQHKAFTQITQADTVQELLSGRADAAVYDAPVTSADIAARFGANAIKFLPSATQPMDVMPCPVAYGIKKGDAEFKQYIDAFFAEKRQSGALKTLFAKWLVPEKIGAQ